MLFFECTDANYDLENNDSRDILSRSGVTLHCSTCQRPPTFKNFLKYYFNNLCFQLLQNVMWSDKITRVVTHKWDRIVPSPSLREHCDLPFLLYFSKQCLLGNTVQRKFQKYHWAISEESWIVLLFQSMRGNRTNRLIGAFLRLTWVTDSI